MFSARTDAPPVEPDKTTSQYLIRADDIEAVPIVRDFQSFIELQAGVAIDEDGRDITVRAGDPEDVAYYIDGVPIPSTDHVEPRVYRNFNRLAIQEMTVVTGGMNAEYGNAQGGIVSVVTREGSEDFHGLLDYQFTPPGKKHWGENVYDSPIHQGNARWDDPDWASERVTMPDGREVLAHPRQDYTSVSGHFVEGNLSGPLYNDLTFFLSNRWTRQVPAFPGPHRTTPFNINTLGKLTYQSSQNLKLKIGTLYDRRQGTTRGPLVGGRLDLRDGVRNLFLNNPNPAGDYVDTDRLSYAGVTHLLSNKTFYEINISQSTSNRDTLDVVLPDGISHISEAVSGFPASDKSGLYTVHRDVVSFQRFSRNRWTFKADLASQLHKRHYGKVGFEIIRYNNWAQLYASENQNTRFVGWYGKTYEDTDFFPDRQNKGLNPIQWSLYVQDKIELDGMIVNAGLRYDAFYQNTDVTDTQGLVGTTPMWSTMTRARLSPKLKGPTIRTWNPRLGISHPLGERSTIRFFYGQFYQLPNFQNLFWNTWTTGRGVDDDLNQNGVIDPAERWNTLGASTIFGGSSRVTAFDYDEQITTTASSVLSQVANHNSYLQPQQTTSFELGMDWNFASDYILGLTVYYKSAHNQPGSGSHSWTEIGEEEFPGIATFVEAVYQDTRGVELNLKKRFSNMFAFNLGLNLQWADQTRFGIDSRVTNADSLFVANGHYWTQYDIDPATGAEIPVSLREMALREAKDPDHYIAHFGHNANQQLQDRIARPFPNNFAVLTRLEESRFAAEGIELRPGEKDQSFYSATDRKYWEHINSTPGYPGTGEGNLWRTGGTFIQSGRTPNIFDRRSFGSLTFLFASPTNFGPFSGKLLGNFRTNLVYRIYTGTPFDPTPTFGFSGAGPSDYGPIHTRVDINTEKGFGTPSGLSVTLGIEIFNLFNQKDVRSRAPGVGRDIDLNKQQWLQYGIQSLHPVEAADAGTSEIHDINNFWDHPRELKFTLRLKW